MIEIHALVHGRVQGVGFRATVRHLANRFGILGTVKNLDDGTVEIYAQGSQQKVDELFNAIKTEMGNNYIESIETHQVLSLNHYNKFNIIF